MHKQLFFLVFFAAVVPAIITAVALFFLIFNVTAEQFGIPEAIVYNLFPAAKKVLFILCIAMPLAIILILFWAHKITHQIVGPFDRILREMDECIVGKKHGPIIVRQRDKMRPLVDRINQLIAKIQSR